MMSEQSADGTERSGELKRFAFERALDAAWATEFWIPGDPDYGFVDYLEAAAARNIGLLHGFEDLAEDASRRGILPQTDSDQARLVTDGGQAADDTERCADCGGHIEETPRWYYGDAYCKDCLYEGDAVGECDGCGAEITNDANLTTVEVDGERQQWCPGCRGAAGDESA